jgi:starch phosphorylase
LYSVLERQVIPEFYERNESGMPAKWLGRIRESMAQLTPEFSASRAIREYTEDYYLPAASGYRDRAAREGALGNSLIQWQRRICPALEFRALRQRGSRDARWTAFFPG